MTSDTMNVTIAGRVVREQSVERIDMDYPGLGGRGEACMGRTRDGDIWAAVGFNVPVLDPATEASPERLFHSADGGQTWTSLPMSPTDWSRMLAFTVLSDDTLLLAVSGLDRLLGRELKIYRSTDRGATWDESARIPASPYQHIGGGFVSMTQIASGAVLLPVSRRTDDTDQPTRQNLVFRSTDGGETWGDSHSTFDHVGEPHIIQLQSGELLGAFRQQRQVLEDDTPEFVEKWGSMPSEGAGDAPLPGGSLFKRVSIGQSRDEGRTWSDLRPLETNDGAPLLDFGECHGQLLQVSDGRVVLVHDRRYPRLQSGTRARVSHDQGRTWEPEVFHLAAGSGYPASVALEDGTIVTVTGSVRSEADATPILPWTVTAIRWRLPAV